MVNRSYGRRIVWLAVFTCLCFAACTKEANVVITTPPMVDSAAAIKFSGSFENGPYGTVSGVVQILKQDSSYILALKTFSSSSGPDLHVYLSKDPNAIEFIDLGTLRSRTGYQLYSIPGKPDFAQYRYALIHFQAYDHLFGRAIFQ